MIPTCGAGVTAAAGTGLTHHLFAKIFILGKSLAKTKHLGSPYHTFVHCRGFAPAAPRRARTSVSVSFSGLPLSWPLQILGLVSHYLTNNLIRRHPILRRRSFKRKDIPVQSSYPILASVFRSYSRPKVKLLTCY
jgi:hypothetical protein